MSFDLQTGHTLDEFTNRFLVNFAVAGQSAGGTLYAVTAGRKLRVTSMVISLTATSQGATLQLTDGSGGTLKLPTHGGQSNSFSVVPVTFIVPLEFLTSVFAVISGVVSYDVAFQGYEQTL